MTPRPAFTFRIALYTAKGCKVDSFEAAIPFAIRELEERLIAGWILQPGDTVQIERVAS